MSAWDNQLQDVFDVVDHRNPGEAEFLQAVREVFDSLSPVIAKHPEYVDVLTRMCEPERQASKGCGGGTLSVLEEVPAQSMLFASGSAVQQAQHIPLMARPVCLPRLLQVIFRVPWCASRSTPIWGA